jgi:hypothetical protein
MNKAASSTIPEVEVFCRATLFNRVDQKQGPEKESDT